jgi:hypothetical protein
VDIDCREFEGSAMATIAIEVKSPLSREELLRRFPESLHCVAYQAERSRYRAICLDLSLVAESPDSIVRAQELLLEQICEYIQDVAALGAPEDLARRELPRIDRARLKALLAWKGVVSLLEPIMPKWQRFAQRAEWRQPVHLHA